MDSGCSPAAAGSIPLFHFCGHRWFGTTRVVAMALSSVALPPAQFNLTVTFGSEEVIPVERLFKAFGLENLAIDPNQVLLPLKLPKDLPLEPTIEQFWQYRSGWELPFDEEYEYRILLPEPAFSHVWDHCTKAFPNRIVSFSGPGRVVGVDLVLKPHWWM